MNKNFLLKTRGAKRLYRDFAKDLPIIDFHNHIDVSALKENKQYNDITELWIAPDPYKHRLMRIFGIDEHFITGDADPFSKFEKFCSIFPYLAGNPVYDWARMELSQVFGINEMPSKDNARKIYDATKEMLRSAEFSTSGIISRFGVEYQSPVASLTDDISLFDGEGIAPSLRGDDLLKPTDELKARISQMSGVSIYDTASYINAIGVVLDRFAEKGCRFADHALDCGFFDGEKSSIEILTLLGNEYSKRGWTLLLHIDAKRKTSPRLASLAGPFGGYAAVGGAFPVSEVTSLLADMEGAGALPDTVLFPLNMSDIPAFTVLQGSFSESGVVSKVGIGPAWWWCDHALGIRTTLESCASFSVLSGFIGMTTDSRSILSFVRHDYFRRLLCTWLDEHNESADLDIPYSVLGDIVTRISYKNAYDKIHRRNEK